MAYGVINITLAALGAVFIGYGAESIFVGIGAFILGAAIFGTGRE